MLDYKTVYQNVYNDKIKLVIEQPGPRKLNYYYFTVFLKQDNDWNLVLDGRSEIKNKDILADLLEEEIILMFIGE